MEKDENPRREATGSSGRRSNAGGGFTGRREREKLLITWVFGRASCSLGNHARTGSELIYFKMYCVTEMKLTFKETVQPVEYQVCALSKLFCMTPFEFNVIFVPVLYF